MQKTINFTSEKLEKNFQDFLQKRPDINELETDFERKIAFAGSLLFDDNGVSEVAKAGGSVQIGDYVYLDSPIDLIWFNSNLNTKKYPIVFLKYFDINENEINKNILESNFRKEIKKTIEFSIKLSQEWEISINNKEKDEIKFDDPEIEKKVDQINQIIQEIDDDNLFSDDGKVKIVKIDFSLVFIFNRLNHDRDKIDQIIEDCKYDVVDFKKSLNKNKIKEIRLFFENDLEDNYKKIITNRFCVEKDYLIIDDSKNVLKYDSIKQESNVKKSVIVNVSARSIFELWNKEGYRDNLLGLNLRYHIKKGKSEKEVDQNITKSMNSEINHEFWFKNNGLVIICNNFEIKSNQIILENFSIVNGGQTTANIGFNDEFKNPDFKDFFVTAKIIRVDGMNSKPSYKVINIANEIAEATNTQKAIKKEDLLVNIDEIKTVWEEFEKNNPKIFMRIRRGEEKPQGNWFLENWQDIEYSVIIQLAAAFEWIKPGTARANKNELLTTKNAKEIFGNFIINNIPTYIDLIKFNFVLNKFDKKRFLKTLESKSEFREIYSQNPGIFNNFFKYCKFFSISLIRILKIFLSFKESIREYYEIIEEKKEVQIKIINWSEKWWNKIENKKIFIEDNIEAIENFWLEIILKKLAGYFKLLYLDEKFSPTNLTKKNEIFYKKFVFLIANDFHEYKKMYKKNIVCDKE